MPRRPRPTAAALVVAAALATVAPSAGAAPPDAGVFVPGRSLGGVALGASRDDVVAAWGAAYGRCRSCTVVTLYFNRFAFRPEGAGVQLAGGRVVSVFTVWAPPAWRTSRGLRIGDPLDRLEATYGRTSRVACAGYDAYPLRGSGTRSVVYVVEGRVWGFALLAGGRTVCL